MDSPKWRIGDKVEFKDPENYQIDDLDLDAIGTVLVVDAMGTFEQHEEPSYDVKFHYERQDEESNDGDWILYKHIVQSSLKSPDDPLARLHDGDETYVD